MAAFRMLEADFQVWLLGFMLVAASGLPLSCVGAVRSRAWLSVLPVAPLACLHSLRLLACLDPALLLTCTSVPAVNTAMLPLLPWFPQLALLSSADASICSMHSCTHSAHLPFPLCAPTTAHAAAAGATLAAALGAIRRHCHDGILAILSARPARGVAHGLRKRALYALIFASMAWTLAWWRLGSVSALLRLFVCGVASRCVPACSGCMRLEMHVSPCAFSPQPH